MTDDTYQHLEQLLRTVRRRLQELEKQEALFGVHTAPEIRIEIEDLQARIRSLEEQKKQLRSNSATGTSATAHTPPPPTLDRKSVTSSSLRLHRLVWIFSTAGIILTLAVAIILYIPHPRMTEPALTPLSTSTSITAIEQQLNEANIVLSNGGPEYTN